MKIGICGGTFDPFHRGHLDTVLVARESMQWDRVLYMPAWRQPFKTHSDAAPGAHRFAMIALAIRDHESLYVSPLELDRGGISYSADTLDELHRRYKGASFDWIIGGDNLNDLHRWKDPERLFQLARFVVLRRSGVGSRESGVGEGQTLSTTSDPRLSTPAKDNPPSPTSAPLLPTPASADPSLSAPKPATPGLRNAVIVFADNDTVPISSTQIRSRVRAGQPIDEFVDPLVSRYIHHYGLYKEGLL